MTATSRRIRISTIPRSSKRSINTSSRLVSVTHGRRRDGARPRIPCLPRSSYGSDRGAMH
jgi:hypothetical protein